MSRWSRACWRNQHMINHNHYQSRHLVRCAVNTLHHQPCRNTSCQKAPLRPLAPQPTAVAPPEPVHSTHTNAYAYPNESDYCRCPSQVLPSHLSSHPPCRSRQKFPSGWLDVEFSCVLVVHYTQQSYHRENSAACTYFGFQCTQTERDDRVPAETSRPCRNILKKRRPASRFWPAPHPNQHTAHTPSLFSPIDWSFITALSASTGLDHHSPRQTHFKQRFWDFSRGRATRSIHERIREEVGGDRLRRGAVSAALWKVQGSWILYGLLLNNYQSFTGFRR